MIFDVGIKRLDQGGTLAITSHIAIGSPLRTENKSEYGRQVAKYCARMVRTKSVGRRGAALQQSGSENSMEFSCAGSGLGIVQKVDARSVSKQRRVFKGREKGPSQTVHRDRNVIVVYAFHQDQRPPSLGPVVVYAFHHSGGHFELR